MCRRFGGVCSPHQQGVSRFYLKRRRIFSRKRIQTKYRWTEQQRFLTGDENGCPYIDYYSNHRRTRIFFFFEGRLLILRLDLIYVWFWILCSENHVKICEPKSRYVTGEVKTGKTKVYIFLKFYCIFQSSDVLAIGLFHWLIQAEADFT
jgi:hypothetical protein